MSVRLYGSYQICQEGFYDDPTQRELFFIIKVVGG